VSTRGTRQIAKRPAPRTVHIVLDDESGYPGWEATARASFPARILFDLDSGDLPRIFAALDGIIVSHNLPDSNDQLAASMADVDPKEGALAIASGLFDAIGKLPNR